MPPSSDASDWLELYRSTVGELYAFVSRRCGGRRELAEDVVQETYLKALDAWPAGRRPEQPLAWLCTVAVNLLRNHFRRAAPEPLAPERLEHLRDGTAGRDPEAAALLHWGLARVGQGPARLLEAFYLDQRDTASLAAELRLSERAVEGRLRRARRKLQRELAPYFLEPGRPS